MTYLAVFRSRAQALDYISALKRAGVPARAVNTPKEAGVGCGISALFDEHFFPRARAVLGSYPYSAFAGFMRKTSHGFTFG